jgi:hypothetical protein
VRLFPCETWDISRPNRVRLTIFVAHKGRKTAYFAISLFGKIWTASLRILLNPMQKMQ